MDFGAKLLPADFRIPHAGGLFNKTSPTPFSVHELSLSTHSEYNRFKCINAVVKLRLNEQ